MFKNKRKLLYKRIKIYKVYRAPFLFHCITTRTPCPPGLGAKHFRIKTGRCAFILNSRLQSQIVYSCISPQAKLFSLQLNNQSKILFRCFLPFALGFHLCSGPGGVHRDLQLSVRCRVYFTTCKRSKLLFTHKKFCFKQMRYLYRLK